MTDKHYTIQDFGPSDLLTSKKIGERAVKVSLDNLTDVELLIIRAIADLSSSICVIADQSRLLNARIEEAFNTGISEEDIR